MVAAIVVGQRIGFGEQDMPSHDVPMVVLGAGLLWFGWFGFNAGSALAPDGVAVNAFVVMNTAVGALEAGMSRGEQVLIQVASVVAAWVWSFVGTGLILVALKSTLGLRVDGEGEEAGLLWASGDGRNNHDTMRILGREAMHRQSHRALILRYGLLLAFIGVGVGPAWAQAGSGFYVSSELGATLASGLDFSGSSNDRESACDEFLNPWYLLGGNRCTKVNRGEGDDWKNIFDRAKGVTAGVALGYRLGDRFRLESEYFFYNAEYDQTSPVTGADGVSFAKLGQEIERAEDRLGNLTSHNLFGNLYFDFTNDSRFTPYVGVGAGVGLTDVDWGSIWARNADPDKITTGADFPFASDAQRVAFRQNLAGTVSSAQGELSDMLFGYQVLSGADYALTDRVSLGVRVRWVNYASFSDDVVWDPLRSHEPNLRRDGSEPMEGWLTSRDVAMFDISMNLKYAF